MNAIGSDTMIINVFDKMSNLQSLSDAGWSTTDTFCSSNSILTFEFLDDGSPADFTSLWNSQSAMSVSHSVDNTFEITTDIQSLNEDDLQALISGSPYSLQLKATTASTLSETLDIEITVVEITLTEEPITITLNEVVLSNAEPIVYNIGLDGPITVTVPPYSYSPDSGYVFTESLTFDPDITDSVAYPFASVVDRVITLGSSDSALHGIDIPIGITSTLNDPNATSTSAQSFTIKFNYCMQAVMNAFAGATTAFSVAD